jgi:hypothetical protein
MYQTSMVRALNPATLFSGRSMPVENPERPAQSRSARARASMHVVQPDEAPQARQWNPTTGMWLLIAGGTAVLVGGAIALYSRKSHAATPGGTVTPGGGGGTEPGGGGGGGGTQHHNNYVGAPGYSWPHKDTFPTEADFVILLGEMGYNVNYNKGVLGWENMVAVRNFQIDYDKVVKTPGLSPAGSSIGVDHVNLSQYPGVPPGQIGGYIGNQTATALYNALQWKQLKSWDDLIQGAP